MLTEFTYVNQVDEEFLLDMVILMRWMSGKFESVNPVKDRPGTYSVIAKLPIHWAKLWYELADGEKHKV